MRYWRENPELYDEIHGDPYPASLIESDDDEGEQDEYSLYGNNWGAKVARKTFHVKHGAQGLQDE